MGVQEVILRHEFDQFALDLEHVLAGRNFGAVGNTEDVGVDCHGELAKRRVQHHIGRFAANAR